MDQTNDQITRTTDENSRDRITSLVIKVLSSEGFFLALIPIFGYSVVFSYQRGYFGYFNMPVQLIRLDLAEIVRISLQTIPSIIALIYLYISIENTKSDLEGEDPILVWTLNISTGLILMLYIASIIFSTSQIALILWLGYLPILLIVVVFIEVYKKWWQPKKKHLKHSPSKRKIKLSDSLDEDKGNKTNKQTKIYAERIYRYVLWFLLITFIITLSGLFAAGHQDGFYIIHQANNKECVALYISAETIICAPLKDNSNEIEGDFHVIQIADNSNIAFEHRSGQIKPKSNTFMGIHLP